MTKRKRLFSILWTLFFIILLSPFLCPPSFSSPAGKNAYMVSFPMTTYVQPFDIELEFKVQIETSPPEQIISGQSKDMNIYVGKETGIAISKYEPFLPQEKTFLTPLGDLPRTRIATFVGELIYYIKLSNACVQMQIIVEGNGTVSPTSLLWSSVGTKSVTVSHTGSTSSQEMLTLQMSLKYMASLTVMSIGAYGIIIEENTQTIEISGTPTISEEIEIKPEKKGICFIATATYGSELSPEVQFLRGFRDQGVMSTFAGSQFMAVFNQFYYSFSPSVASVIADNSLVRGVMNVILYPLIGILHLASVAYSIFSFIPELAIVLSGLVASSLIGIVYLTPLLVILLRIKRIRKHVLKTMKLLSIILASSLVLILTAEIVSSATIMMLSTGTLVLVTLSLSALGVSKGIIKLIEH